MTTMKQNRVTGVYEAVKSIDPRWIVLAILLTVVTGGVWYLGYKLAKWIGLNLVVYNILFGIGASANVYREVQIGKKLFKDASQAC